MVAIPGSDMLSAALHVISQSLLIPVIVGLLAFMIYAIISFGGMLSEYSGRIKFDVGKVQKIINEISNPGTLEHIMEVIEKSDLPKNHKEILINLAGSTNIGSKSREALARKLIENEELKIAKSLEKTDIVTRLGPTLGLMGTLIPMGPGLASLGAGDIAGLSEAIIIAFDTTVVGLAAGGIAFVISKVRRRWYEDNLTTLETLSESILEVLEDASKTKAPVA
jgi:biopolymer transport protein ExbB/TolQ